MAMFSVHGLQQDFDGTLHMRWLTYIVETASYHAAAIPSRKYPISSDQGSQKGFAISFLAIVAGPGKHAPGMLIYALSTGRGSS